jgi:hypothetical protein
VVACFLEGIGDLAELRGRVAKHFGCSVVTVDCEVGVEAGLFTGCLDRVRCVTQVLGVRERVVDRVDRFLNLVNWAEPTLVA